jgi:hypothetical protein
VLHEAEDCFDDLSLLCTRYIHRYEQVDIVQLRHELDRPVGCFRKLPLQLLEVRVLAKVRLLDEVSAKGGEVLGRPHRHTGRQG